VTTQHNVVSYKIFTVVCFLSRRCKRQKRLKTVGKKSDLIFDLTKPLFQIVRHVLNLVPEDHPNSRNNTFWGVIGPETSAVSTPTAKLLGLFHMPQVEHLLYSVNTESMWVEPECGKFVSGILIASNALSSTPYQKAVA